MSTLFSLPTPFADFGFGKSSIRQHEKQYGLGRRKPAKARLVDQNLLRAAFRIFYVLVSLLLSLFGFSLNLCTRIERLDGLPEAHRLRRRGRSSIRRNAQHLVFQRCKAAGDIEILGDVGSSDALTEILEALASRRSIHSSKLRDPVCQFRVVRELLGHALLTTLGRAGRVTAG